MPTFYDSGELRWFLRDSLAQWDPLLRWFRRQDAIPLVVEDAGASSDVCGPAVKQEKRRTDEYLLVPDCDSVGVKQRQGKLEVKGVVTASRPYAIPSAGATGRVDQWVKWSFASQSPAQLEHELRDAGPWRSVVKDRYLQKYSFDSGRVVAVSPEAHPDTGCNIELTRIGVGDRSREWVTLGFEAFGPSARVMAILDQAVDHYFTAHGAPPVTLEARDSCSYPAWLAERL